MFCNVYKISSSSLLSVKVVYTTRTLLRAWLPTAVSTDVARWRAAYYIRPIARYCDTVNNIEGISRNVKVAAEQQNQPCCIYQPRRHILSSAVSQVHCIRWHVISTP